MPAKRTRIITLTLIMACHVTTAMAQREDMSTLFDFHHVLAYIVAGLFIALFVLMFYNRLLSFKEERINRHLNVLTTQLSGSLEDKIRVWTFDIAKRQYRRLSRNGRFEGNYAPIDFQQFFERDDFERMRQNIFDIRDGKATSATVYVRGRKPKQKHQPQKVYEVSIKVLKYNEENRPAELIGVQQDITESTQSRQHDDELLSRYRTLFDQSLIDMIYYNADGVMTDINDRACQTFSIGDRQAFLANRPTVESNPGYTTSGFDGETKHFTTIIEKLDLKDVEVKKRMYYEMEFTGVYNAEGKLTSIFSAGRDVSETVENQHRQREAIKQLSRATANIEDYVHNINFVMQTGNIQLMNYYPETHVLTISNDLNATRFELTQLRCLALVHTDHVSHARRILRKMDQRADTKIEQRLCTILRDSKGRNLWFAFSIMPIYDKQGDVNHYFGMFRNDTEMVATEQQLKLETQKARETELLKDSFLTNMSYEIRTPLNAVLGFASLLNTEHDVADEPVFVEQIKENSNKLLLLVNDVLFLSRLDAKMVEYNHQPTDLASVFEAYCHMGWSSSLKPGVNAVTESPYDHLVVEIDSKMLELVTEKLCANAASHTSEGTVRAKYEYRREALNITIEDTGVGLDKDALAHVFDRFVTDKNHEHWGTGLDLPIVKEIVEQMGGVIDMVSEPDKGTSVWVSFPCKLIEMNLKKEIIA